MEDAATPHVRHAADADGFAAWSFPGDRFDAALGRLSSRVEGEAVVRVRTATEPRHGNLLGSLHGGFMLAVLDQALFVGPGALDRLAPGGAVTLTTATQFVAAGTPGLPLDCVVEIVRETRRLIFLRGQMEQDGAPLLSFQATLSKRAAPER